MMLNEIFQFSFLLGLLTVTLRITSPILLMAIGRLAPSLAGIVDLSPEGGMLMGAFAGFVVAERTGSLWLGVMAGALGGLLLSLLSVLLIVVLKMDQSVTGIGVNILAAGLSFYLYRSVYSSVGASLPHTAIFQPISIPGLSNIPFIGQVLFSQHALTYLTYFIAILAWFFLFKTKFGLIVRFTGENPRTVDTKGINVNAVHAMALMFAGLMYGIAGAFLPLVSVGLFQPNMSAGRGWIAVALVSFGRYRVGTIILGALLFGFLEAFQLQIQGVGINFPYQIMTVLPYVVTILVLISGRKGASGPQHLGISYERE
jgi:general nucleoside transport system permease protein